VYWDREPFFCVSSVSLLNIDGRWSIPRRRLLLVVSSQTCIMSVIVVMCLQLNTTYLKAGTIVWGPHFEKVTRNGVAQIDES
jgi:hypothetical protein